jgi:hypothetical protein
MPVFNYEEKSRSTVVWLGGKTFAAAYADSGVMDSSNHCMR